MNTIRTKEGEIEQGRATVLPLSALTIFISCFELVALNSRKVDKLTVKATFHYAIWSQTGPKLVADLQQAEIWPIIKLASSELARASRSATGLRPASDLYATRIA